MRPPSASRRRVLMGAAALAGSLAGSLAACSRSEAPTDEQGRVRLRFATDALAQAEHGGFYQAVANGAYEGRGLNVQIVQGDPAADVPQRLASGAVELGLASSSLTPLDLVSQGAPVKAVAAFFQKSPLVVLAHPDPALRALADLRGRALLMDAAATRGAWPWLKAEHGFTDDQIRAFTGDPAAFLRDPRAVQSGSLTHDPYAIRQAGGFDPRVFLLADDGYPSYAALVLAPNAFARDNAQALRDFIAGSVEGWRDYLHGDARAADALIRKDNPAMTQAMLDQARDLLRTSGMVDGGDAALYGLGAMTAERWQAFFDMAAQAGVYDPGLNWRAAFTDAYLPGRN
ncbi:MAG TPA: ABC transporter substrate-binding protein [Brevundimonas sp.]|uniref:ABC transporter substrate-binding protein n=1 Tax=Brevundimonas sp. TaxID=1871086 RepID=UPI00260305DB|nr:ABC transporter substrate-binding protein [Brevundimonas sp.]HRO31983.1 ABC transporter substrate-binding protein [Brevundimonas sp.]